MAEKLYDLFFNQAHVIIGVVLTIIVVSLIQAVMKVMRDWFLIKVFKKKLNDNNKGNGKLGVKFDELIEVHEKIGKKHDERLAGIEGKIGGMHDIICETDENKFPKIRVMEKKVKEIWDKLVRGTTDG